MEYWIICTCLKLINRLLHEIWIRCQNYPSSFIVTVVCAWPPGQPRKNFPLPFILHSFNSHFNTLFSSWWWVPLGALKFAFTVRKWPKGLIYGGGQTCQRANKECKYLFGSKLHHCLILSLCPKKRLHHISSCASLYGVFVHRWPRRGPVPLGRGASSAAWELGGERGIIGTRLLISKETCDDNLRAGMRNEVEGDLWEERWLTVGVSVCLLERPSRGGSVTESDSRRTGAMGLVLFGAQQFLKSQTQLSNGPTSVRACVCVLVSRTHLADTRNQMDRDRLYTILYYFCMIHLRLKKNPVCQTLSLRFLLIFFFFDYDVCYFTSAVVEGNLIAACSHSKLPRWMQNGTLKV